MGKERDKKVTYLHICLFDPERKATKETVPSQEPEVSVFKFTIQPGSIMGSLVLNPSFPFAKEPTPFKIFSQI